MGTCQRLLGDVDEQRLGTFEKRLGAFRPASRLEIPVERFHGVTFDNSGIGKNTRVSFEFGQALSERVPCRGQNILLQKYVGRDRCRQGDQCSRGHREISPAASVMGNIDAGCLFQCPRRPSGRVGHQNVKHADCAALGNVVGSARNVINQH